MTKRKPKDGEYTIGYGRPPKASQFTEGKSGNPKGKLKGTRSLAAYLKDVLSSKVTVTENGKSRKVPRLQVILQRLTNDAMRGEKTAVKLVVDLLGKYDSAPDLKVNLKELLSEDAAILAQARHDGLLPDLKPEETPNLGDDEMGGPDKEGGDDNKGDNGGPDDEGGNDEEGSDDNPV